MADEATPTPAPAAPVDTPNLGTDQPTPDTPAVNEYQQKYEHLQPEYTRATQELARFKSDPEFRAQLFRDLASEQGYTIEDPDPQPVGDEPMTRAEFEAWQTEQQKAQQQAQAEAALDAHVNTQVGQIEGLDKADRDWVISRAFGMDPGPDGMPDIQGAYQALVARDTEAQKRWKTTKQAPHVPATGQTGTETPYRDDMTQQERQAAMVEQLAALNAD